MLASSDSLRDAAAIFHGGFYDHEAVEVVAVRAERAICPTCVTCGHAFRNFDWDNVTGLVDDLMNSYGRLRP